MSLNMSSIENHFDFEYQNIIRSQTQTNERPNGSQSEVQNDINIRDLYESFEMDSNEWFVCNECQQTERNESEMYEHLKEHLTPQQINRFIVPKEPKNKVTIELTDNFTDSESTDKSSFDQMITSFDDNQNNGLTTDSAIDKDFADECWMNWYDIRTINGREQYSCKWFNCDFGSNLKIKVKHHINRHLQQNITPNTASAQTESQFWNEVLKDVMPEEISTQSITPLTQSTPKHKQNTNKKGVSEELVNPLSDRRGVDSKVESKTSQLIDVNFDRNNFSLSLKGMASVSKLKNYIRLGVENNRKMYFCKYNKTCSYKSKRTQEIAQHIHTAHIGFFLKCVQIGCNRVFRTPSSWREHMKNHICNFGIYGFQKNVTGVCRNDTLLRYRERTLIDGRKGYRCVYPGCDYTTVHHTSCKRHIHNQHICPYRATDGEEWKSKLSESTQYMEQMPDIPINAIVPLSAINESKEYLCHRNKCRAQFSNEAELKKHENLLCKFRKTTKNANNLLAKHKHKSYRTMSSKPKDIKSKNSKTKRTKDLAKTESTRQKREENDRKIDKSTKNEEIVRKTRQQNTTERQMKMTSNWSSNLNNRSDIKTKFGDNVEEKKFEGVIYYLCKYKDCKFVTKITDKINEHFSREHKGFKTTTTKTCEALNAIEGKGSERQKRKQSSINSTIDETEAKVKKVKSNDNNSQKSQSQNGTEVQEERTERTDAYIMKRIDNEPNYFCKHNDCKYYSTSIREIQSHIECSHVFFDCDDPMCERRFKTQNLLSVHKRNHICGFGIRGRKTSGVCDLDNIRKYRGEEVSDNRYVYPCKYLDCQYFSDSKTTTLSHIHNRHICPNREQKCNL